MSAEMEKLAARVEALGGPDREVDAAVFRAIGAPVPFQFASKMVALVFDEADQCYYAPVGDMRVRYTPPAYTASLDAAMTLVPEGQTWGLTTSKTQGVLAEVYQEDADGRTYGRQPSGKATTPALALCAAALRALARARPTTTGESGL